MNTLLITCCVANGNRRCLWEPQFSPLPPQIRLPKNLSQIHRPHWTRYQIWWKSTNGSFWTNAWNITKILFIYLYPLFGNHLQVRPVSGFSHMIAQMACTHTRMCLLEFHSYCCPFRRLNSPKAPTFWVWIGVFKPNMRNIQTFILSTLQHQSQPNFAHW